MSVEMLLSVLLRIVLALEKIKLERLFFLHAIRLSKRHTVYSCRTVNSDFIINVFDTRKRGIDFYNPYLSIDRYQEEKEKGE